HNSFTCDAEDDTVIPFCLQHHVRRQVLCSVELYRASSLPGPYRHVVGGTDTTRFRLKHHLEIPSEIERLRPLIYDEVTEVEAAPESSSRTVLRLLFRMHIHT